MRFGRMRHAYMVFLVAGIACDTSNVFAGLPDVPAPPPMNAAPTVLAAAPVVPELPVAPEPHPEEIARMRIEQARRAFDAAYPLHGISFHFLARVHSEPDMDSFVLGYLRRGSRFRASSRVEGVGCARGWYGVPGGGFVCRGEGFVIGEGPQTFEPAPLPPSLEDALPYPYAYVAAHDVPQYWRLPTPAEEAEVVDAFARLAREEASAPAEAPSGVEAPAPPGQSDDATPETEAEAEAVEIAGVELPEVLRMRMRRGYYVSLDGEEETEAGKNFLRSVRGNYVPSSGTTMNEPPTHRGALLGERWTLPIGFVFRGGTKRLRREGMTDRYVDDGEFDRLAAIRVAGAVVRGGQEYVLTEEGTLARRSSVRVAQAMERPSEIAIDDRWVHVDLSEQTIVAYEGDSAKFVSVISSGREGFATPTGIFRIQSKHVSTTMDDLNAGEDAYMIEDVPWTMYFEGNFALHAAFWHSQFGRVRSHGCVNMAPADARWVFGFLGPELPPSWHGVFATRQRPGSFVVITE